MPGCCSVAQVQNGVQRERNIIEETKIIVSLHEKEESYSEIADILKYCLWYSHIRLFVYVLYWTPFLELVLFALIPVPLSLTQNIHAHSYSYFYWIQTLIKIVEKSMPVVYSFMPPDVLFKTHVKHHFLKADGPKII